jgi:hypothetical protein
MAVVANAMALAREVGTGPTTIALPAHALGPMLRLGFYSPSHPQAYLDHVKRTSPKPKLR